MNDDTLLLQSDLNAETATELEETAALIGIK